MVVSVILLVGCGKGDEVRRLEEENRNLKADRVKRLEEENRRLKSELESKKPAKEKRHLPR